MLAEQESTNALRLLHSIAEHLNVKDLPAEEALEAETDIQELVQDLEHVTE